MDIVTINLLDFKRSISRSKVSNLESKLLTDSTRDDHYFALVVTSEKKKLVIALSGQHCGIHIS